MVGDFPGRKFQGESCTARPNQLWFISGLVSGSDYHPEDAESLDRMRYASYETDRASTNQISFLSGAGPFS